jgi:PRC-barrel domain
MDRVYCFRSGRDPELTSFTDESSGAKLPPEDGPWTFEREIRPDADWTEPVSKRVVLAGIYENGFYLWGPPSRAFSKPIIESDRVEGTAVFDKNSKQIGTIERLLIEKVSGRVLYLDISFGGFLGLGEQHYTIPWEKLAYDIGLGGYRTNITAEQVRGAPPFYEDAKAWPDRQTEQDIREYWRGLSSDQ